MPCIHSKGCGAFDGTAWTALYRTGPIGKDGQPRYGKGVPVCPAHASKIFNMDGGSVRVVKTPGKRGHE